MEGKVMAVCTSPEKGTGKTPRDSIRLLPDYGIEGDAHAGKWHRQVSLLSYEEIEAFRARGAEIALGSFGENIVLSGFDLKTLPVGTRLRIGEVLLEISQIGKNCHSHCAIYKTMGDCIMPGRACSPWCWRAASSVPAWPRSSFLRTPPGRSGPPSLPCRTEPSPAAMRTAPAR